jgi:TRAP-type mannitol/chloroaromatic compound transport system substrate-binding protein
VEENMLKQTTSILAIVMASSFVSLASGPSYAQTVEGPSVNWELSTWGPPRAFTKGIEVIRDQLAERTEGRFTITIQYAEAISPARENLDGLQIGAFDMAQICAFYHPGKNPLLVAGDLPFLPIPDFDVKQAVTDAYFQHPAVVAEMERWNAKLLFDNLLPQYEFFGVGAQPTDMDGWRGKRVRTPGGIGRAMSLLGAVPTTVPAPEVYTSLDRGLLDAASFPYTYSHIAYGLHEISDWHTANMSPGSAVCPTLVSIDSWNALPEEYRELFMELMPDAIEQLKEAYAEADRRNFPIMREAGLEPIEYTDEQLTEFRRVAAQPIWDEWVAEVEAQGLPGQEILDIILEAAEEARS